MEVSAALEKRTWLRLVLISVVVSFLACIGLLFLMPGSINIIGPVSAFLVITSGLLSIHLLYLPCPSCGKRFSPSGVVNLISFPPLGAFATRCSNCRASLTRGDS